MSEAKKGPLFDPGICRCCGSMKKCRLLTAGYEWMGIKEVYSDMLFECFGLTLENLDGVDEGKLICAPCVSRLRDANMFRKQVLECEQMLLQSQMEILNVSDDLEIKEEHLDETIYDSAWINDIETEPCDDIDMPGENDETDYTEIADDETNKSQVRRSSRTFGQTNRLVKVNVKNDPSSKLKKKERTNINTRRMARANTVAIIENSYVCPFKSIYSTYYCVYCRKDFIEASLLREHTLTHDPKNYKLMIPIKKPLQFDIERIDCRLCSVEIKDVQELKVHLKSKHRVKIHNVADEFVCFRLGADLSCLECGDGFGFFHALQKHMAKHFGSWICDMCGAHYYEERVLIMHQRSHYQNTDVFPCSECNKTFKSKHSRHLHEASKHKRESTFPCSKCSESFISYARRFRHMIEAHGQIRIFQCELCDRKYDSMRSLREHNRKVHLKITKHQCEVCDQRFYLPSTLKEHMAIHTGERNYRCEYCGKCYPRLRTLRAHVHSHSIIKRFKCRACEMTFAQKVSLKNHLKRHHPDYDEQWE